MNTFRKEWVGGGKRLLRDASKYMGPSFIKLIHWENEKKKGKRRLF